MHRTRHIAISVLAAFALLVAALIESHAKKLKSAEDEEGLASFAEKRAAKWPP